MHRRCSRASLLPHRSRSLVLLRSFIAAEHRDCTPIMLVHCFLFFFPLSLSLSHGTRSSQSIIIAERLSTLLCTYDNRTVCPNCVVRYFQKAKAGLLVACIFYTNTPLLFFLSSLFSSSDVMRCEFLGGWERERDR